MKLLASTIVLIVALPIGSIHAADMPFLEEQLLAGEVLRQRIDALDELVLVTPPDKSIRLLHDIEALADAARPETLDKATSVKANQLQQGLHILHYFLENCTEKFAAHQATRSELLAMLVRVANSSNRLLSGETRGLAYQRLMELAPDEEARTDYVLMFIERENHAVGWRGVKLLNEKPALDPPVVTRLRTAVSDALVAGHANALALAVLAHHGDEAILSELREASKRFPMGTENRRLLDNAVWGITHQHPPERLLEFLQGGSVEASPSWVVERAKQLQLPEAKLREAVLAYYARCPKEQLRSFRIAGLDAAVVKNGILEKSQLPPK